MERNLSHLDALQWVIMRIDGRIASVSTDLGSFARTASRMSSWTADRITEISCRKISTGELFSLAEESTWDDLMPLGTPFQKKVWKTLFSLTHSGQEGEKQPVRLYSYSDFAALCGNRSGVRAVAHAVGLNPIPVIIPCHLIIPKETSDRILAIEKEAEATLFGKDGLCIDLSYDFGEFSCPGGKLLKRSLIARHFDSE